MMKKKVIEKEKTEEDFDYVIEDIESYYEREENEETNSAERALIKNEQPRVRRIRSKYSNGVRMLEIIAGILEKSAVYSVKIHSDTTEISDFRKHKGIYATAYYFVKPMFGTLVTDSIEKLEKAYSICIKRYADKTTDKRYQMLLKVAKLYEAKIHMALMISRVSFETEMIGRGPVAKQQILS